MSKLIVMLMDLPVSRDGINIETFEQGGTYDVPEYLYDILTRDRGRETQALDHDEWMRREKFLSETDPNFIPLPGNDAVSEGTHIGNAMGDTKPDASNQQGQQPAGEGDEPESGDKSLSAPDASSEPAKVEAKQEAQTENAKSDKGKKPKSGK